MTVKKYRLPDTLGGWDVQIVAELSGSEVQVMILDGPHAGLLLVLARSMLVEVKPPMPEEPGPGAWSINGQACFRTTEKPGQEAWSWPQNAVDSHRSWFEWDELRDRLVEHYGPGITVVPLVPDPLAEAPGLPWLSESDLRAFGVQVMGDRPEVRIFLRDRDDSSTIVRVSARTAEQAGLALLRAAKTLRGEQGSDVP